jgi:hypothetical protein
MKTWTEGGDFRARVLKDPDITARLPKEKIEGAFSLNTYLRNVDAIFTRVFGDSEGTASTGQHFEITEMILNPSELEKRRSES